jgi:hypothetical protein
MRATSQKGPGEREDLVGNDSVNTSDRRLRNAFGSLSPSPPVRFARSVFATSLPLVK